MSFTLPTTGPTQQAVETTHRLPRQQDRTALTRALDTLAADLDGTLARPDDPTWDGARTAWNLAVDQRPTAVVIAETVRDVVSVVHTAREHGLRVAPQSTGHNAGPLGDLAGTILLKTSAMRDVQIDPVARVARAEGGAMWMDVTPAAAEHGLAALAGSAPDVGVSGYTLGGGMSWLARSHGLAANSVRRPSRWSPPTACTAASTRPTSPSCSGPCAGAAAASASSPRSSSGCTRSPRCTPACCSSRSTAPPRCSRPGGSGCPRYRTR